MGMWCQNLDKTQSRPNADQKVARNFSQPVSRQWVMTDSWFCNTQPWSNHHYLRPELMLHSLEHNVVSGWSMDSASAMRDGGSRFFHAAVGDEQGWPFPKTFRPSGILEESFSSESNASPRESFLIRLWQWHFHWISHPVLVPSSMGSAASLESWYLQCIGQGFKSLGGKKIVIFWGSQSIHFGHFGWFKLISHHIIPDLCMIFMIETTFGRARWDFHMPNTHRTSDQHAAFGLCTCPSAEKLRENWVGSWRGNWMT